MARHIADQVAKDIKDFTATGKLPKAWDEVPINKRTGLDYWDWCHRWNSGHEPELLRQDEITEEDGHRLYKSNAFKQRAAELIHECGPEWFTVREMLAYSLCYVDGLTEREAAEKMGVSQPRVFELKAGIQKKLRKFLGEVLSNV